MPSTETKKRLSGHFCDSGWLICRRHVTSIMKLTGATIVKRHEETLRALNELPELIVKFASVSSSKVSSHDSNNADDKWMSAKRMNLRIILARWCFDWISTKTGIDTRLANTRCLSFSCRLRGDVCVRLAPNLQSFVLVRVRVYEQEEKKQISSFLKRKRGWAIANLCLFSCHFSRHRSALAWKFPGNSVEDIGSGF